MQSDLNLGLGMRRKKLQRHCEGCTYVTGKHGYERVFGGFQFILAFCWKVIVGHRLRCRKSLEKKLFRIFRINRI